MLQNEGHDYLEDVLSVYRKKPDKKQGHLFDLLCKLILTCNVRAFCLTTFNTQIEKLPAMRFDRMLVI